MVKNGNSSEVKSSDLATITEAWNSLELPYLLSDVGGTRKIITPVVVASSEVITIEQWRTVSRRCPKS